MLLWQINVILTEPYTNSVLVTHDHQQAAVFNKHYMFKPEISNRLSISKPGMIKLIWRNTFFSNVGELFTFKYKLFVTQLFYNNYNS